MKILITGSGGLVGRNLVECLEKTSHELLTPTHGELDLLNRADVHTYLKSNKPDCVIHLAARVGSIAANVQYPLQFLVENLDMGRNVIISAYENGIKKLINIGSACVYPAESGGNLLREEMVLTGSFEREYVGYATAKAAALTMCQCISANNPQFLYKTLIPCSIYGRWCSFGADKSTMIAAAIKKIHRAKKDNLPCVQIWGDGTARRELIYAGDLAKIISVAAENLETIPPVLNVGTGIDYAVNDCYEIIAKILGYEGEFVHDLSKPSGTSRRLLDVKLMHKVELFAESSLEQGIRETIDYYQTHVLKEGR